MLNGGSEDLKSLNNSWGEKKAWLSAWLLNWILSLTKLKNSYEHSNRAKPSLKYDSQIITLFHSLAHNFFLSIIIN